MAHAHLEIEFHPAASTVAPAPPRPPRRPRRPGRRTSGRGWWAAGWVALASMVALAGMANVADGADGAGMLPQRAAAETAAVQYALIINGDDSVTHNANVELALAALSRLGYRGANTFLLTANPRQPDLPAGIHSAPATRGALHETLAALARRLRAGDRLLVYLTGHGTRFFGRPLLSLASGSVGAEALAHGVSALAFDELILVADQCYSGAFVKAFTAIGRNVVAVSSADEAHEVRCEPFVRPFWLAAAEGAGAGNGKSPASVEDAFRAGAASLASGAGQPPPGSGPQYAASGTCMGRENSF